MPVIQSPPAVTFADLAVLGEQAGNCSVAFRHLVARAEICGSIIAVSVQPGQMQLTVIPPSSREPMGAYSSAATRDNPTRPNFAET